MTTEETNIHLQNLNSRNWAVRQAAFTALAPLAKDDEAVKTALLERTKDQHWAVRQAACTALAPLVPTNQAVRDALAFVRDDIFDILSHAPSEVPALRAALINGKVDGSTYKGECACLVGTLANARGCGFTAIPGVVPDANRPAERFFAGIRRGNRPDAHPIAAAAMYWVDEWMRQREDAALRAAQK